MYKLKLNIVYLLVFMFTDIIFAQTNISGNQSGTWTIADSPYLVTGDITVANGDLLYIEAGVQVIFQNHYKFTVNGTIEAHGTKNSRIIFTAQTEETGWGGIRFDTNPHIGYFYYCTFEYGKATGSYPDMHGGAIMLKESDAEFYDCKFINNKAVGSGDDGMGGAVYCINTGASGQNLTKFVRCEFIDNESVTEGGAIKFTNDVNTIIDDCKFISNIANYGGGAIMFYSAQNTILKKCMFYRNIANNSGGGAIKSLNPTVSFSVINCDFVENKALGAGEGGALCLDYSDVNIKNTIIFDNQQIYGDEIHIGMDTTVNVSYSDLVVPSEAVGTNNITQDPLFVDQVNGDLHLQANSPCIDAGIDVNIPFVGAAPDIGCFEYGATELINEYETNMIIISPNPVDDYIKITGKINIKKIIIIDLLGKKYIETKGRDIDISKLASGEYIIVVITENKQIFNKKLIKN